MKILAIQNRMGIGDMVIFLPFIEAISENFNSPITLLVKESSKAKEYLYNNSKIKQIVDLNRGNKKNGHHDGIFGFFSTKKKISGSGDPFGIRRTTISIIKILIENNLELDLYQLMQECQEIYKKQNLNFLKDLSFIQSFFNKRIEIFFAEIGCNQEIIRSNLKRDSFNPRVILEKIKSLKNFLNSESGKLFLKAFKRLSSIIDDVEDKGNIDESLFQKKEERNLYESIKVIKGKNKTYYKKIYEDIYSQISIQIDHFLDNVMVNDEDANVRKNRKLLLLECKKVLNLNFNFSVLGN